MSTTDKKHWIWGNCVERFKKTFAISRATFRYILDRIEPILKDISPDERLAICLYRLGRGDYYYRIAEMVGRRVSTASSTLKRFHKYQLITCETIVFQYTCLILQKLLRTKSWTLKNSGSSHVAGQPSMAAISL